MSKKPFTAEVLDKAGCGTPDCGHDHSVLYLHPKCHMSAGTRVRYEKKDQTLIVDCIKCGAEVARIRVATS